MSTFLTLLAAFVAIATFGVGTAPAMAFWIAMLLALAWFLACWIAVVVVASFLYEAAAMMLRKLREAS